MYDFFVFCINVAKIQNIIKDICNEIVQLCQIWAQGNKTCSYVLIQLILIIEM